MKQNIKGYLKNKINNVVKKHFGMITHVETDDPIVSITFDDGPDPIYTPKVLSILRKYEAKATFFMVGEGAQKYPDIVEQIVREGHAIGNHSWSHLALPFIPLKDQWSEIRKCHRALRRYDQKIFRPPYGLNNNKSNMGAILWGYKVVGWSLSSEDWYEADSAMIINRLVQGIKPGAIILLHDRLFDQRAPKKGRNLSQEPIIDRGPMLLALRALLERMRGRIQFVTIPVLLSRGRPYREAL